MRFNDDGLYFDTTAGWQWVAEVDVALNLQGNNLTQPDQLQASHSWSFTLPDTAAIRTMTDSAEQLDAGSQYPYRLLPARLVVEGETIFDGVAKLDGFSSGWSVALYDPFAELFNRLEGKKLTDLPLSALDFPWTVDTIRSRAEATDGVLFPFIDYGAFSEGVQPSDTLFPAVYVRTLIDAMLRTEGYRPGGDWLDTPLLRRLVMPFSSSKPRSRDEQWVKDRTARVTVGDTASYLVSPGAIGGRRNLSITVPLTVDDRLTENFLDGALNNFKPDLFSYVADTAMRLHIYAYQRFRATVVAGAAEVVLIVEVNGQAVTQGYWTQDSGYNLTHTATDTVEVDAYIPVSAGDRVRLRLRAGLRTTLGRADIRLGLNSTDTVALFEPDPTVRFGDTWPVAMNLPDMSCMALLRTIALMHGATFEADGRRRTLTLRRLTDTVTNLSGAQDWSERIDESVTPELRPVLSPYAQKNHLKWRVQEGVPTGYGDGMIPCLNTTLEAETTLFELPFAATASSPRTLAGYGNPLLVETRTVGTGGAVSEKDTAPRLLLAEPTAPVAVPTKVLNSDGTIAEVTVPLLGCWFATRSPALIRPDNGLSLSFDPVSNGSEAGLIQQHFTGIQQMLRRVRVFTLSVCLFPEQITTLNLFQPVRLRRVRLGPLDIGDHYFYINRISNYRPGFPCPVTLIAI